MVGNQLPSNSFCEGPLLRPFLPEGGVDLRHLQGDAVHGCKTGPINRHVCFSEEAVLCADLWAEQFLGGSACNLNIWRPTVQADLLPTWLQFSGVPPLHGEAQRVGPNLPAMSTSPRLAPGSSEASGGIAAHETRVIRTNTIKGAPPASQSHVVTPVLDGTAGCPSSTRTSLRRMYCSNAMPTAPLNTRLGCGVATGVSNLYLRCVSTSLKPGRFSTPGWRP